MTTEFKEATSVLPCKYCKQVPFVILASIDGKYSAIVQCHKPECEKEAAKEKAIEKWNEKNK